MNRIAVVILIVLAACTENPSTPGESGKVGPAYPNSRVLREVEFSSAELYTPPGGGYDCSMQWTDYGTEDSPEKVTAFYQRLGFVRRGQRGQFGKVYRWAAAREGDDQTWRKVDIADRATAGRPEWTAVFSVFKPRCGGATEPQGKATPAPARSFPR